MLKPTKKWAFAHSAGSTLKVHCTVFMPEGEGEAKVARNVIKHSSAGNGNANMSRFKQTTASLSDTIL
jgi:hypothetical protein